MVSALLNTDKQYERGKGFMHEKIPSIVSTTFISENWILNQWQKERRDITI